MVFTTYQKRRFKDALINKKLPGLNVFSGKEIILTKTFPTLPISVLLNVALVSIFFQNMLPM